MIRRSLKLSYAIVAVCLLFAQYALAMPTDDDLAVLLRLGYFAPAPPEPELSSDGMTLYNGGLPVVYVDNPDSSHVPAQIPAPFDLLGLPESATASFSITYVSSGATDLWGEPCYTFPSQAQAPFNAAANIWGNIIQSSVPITIRTCWANLGSSSILGYSGGGPLRRDFTGAPVANTWYGGSLANALAGYDLESGSFDMHITYNLNFSWYYGTDGNTPAGQYDLMSVVLHEIAHGLNFTGSMQYSAGSGSWGYGTGYPNIYDIFMRDGSGNQLINMGVYGNPSTALGTALTSNNIWFHGSNAMAANGGVRVKMYAPSTWSGGSSYAHLDYTTFNDTINELMVFAISSGESIHDPGPVTKGLLKDLGWPWTCLTPAMPLSPSPQDGATGVSNSPTLSWTSANADSYDVYFGTSSNPPYVVNTTSASYPRSGLSNTTTYYWKIVAKNNCGGSTTGSVWSFTTSKTTPLNDTTEFVKQQYRDFLNREAEPGGLAYWVNMIDSGSMTKAQVIESFLWSNEFGVKIAPIVRLYFAYFLRIPDYAGLMFWINAYNSGWSLGGISDFFASSPEFVATYGSLTNEQFVTLVYQNVLGRAPEPGGYAFWVDELNSGRRTRGRVMLEFSESTEYKGLSNNQVYVTMMYIGMLRRSPDEGGFNFWVNYLDSGNSGLELINGFLYSQEYADRF